MAVIVSDMHGRIFPTPAQHLLVKILQFDINGNTGGCQATYTVIPGSTKCSNVTFPKFLDVVGEVAHGPLLDYEWVGQVRCYIILIVGAVSCLYPLVHRYLTHSKERDAAVHFHRQYIVIHN